jgi:hypothetical protein
MRSIISNQGHFFYFHEVAKLRMEQADLSEIWIYFFRTVNLFPDSRVYSVEYFAGTYYSYGDQNDYRVNEFEIGATFRPNTALSLSVSPSYEFSMNELQYDKWGQAPFIFISSSLPPS